MKTFRLISAGLFAVLFCFTIASCSEDEGEISKPITPEYTVDPEIERLSSEFFNTKWELIKCEEGNTGKTKHTCCSFIIMFSDEIGSNDYYLLKIRGGEEDGYWRIDESGMTYVTTSYFYERHKGTGSFPDWSRYGGCCHKGKIKKVDSDELIIENNYGDLLYFERSYYSSKEFDEDTDIPNDYYEDDDEDDEKEWRKCALCRASGDCYMCSGDGTIGGGDRECSYCRGSGICHWCDGAGGKYE